MKFFFSFIILFVMIISNKLFLFNEEFLILLSFTGFCFIISENISLLIKTRFNDKIFSIKKNLLTSINNFQIYLIQKKELNIKSKKLLYILISLKKYYLNFSTQFLAYLLNYLKINEKTNLVLKLKELKFIENSYSKFIILLILKKIQEISIMNYFFEHNLEIKRFQTLRLINNLKSIKKI